MSETATANRTITKSLLAALLNIPEEDLLTRAQAADQIGVSPGYLANLANRNEDDGSRGPAYYRSTTGPTAGNAWYPRAEVEAYARHRRSKIVCSYGGLEGQQDWTKLHRDAAPLSIHTVVSMINDWKASELYRRAQAILHDPNPANDRKRFDEECRLLGVGLKGCRLAALGEKPDQGVTPVQRKAIFESLNDQSDVTERHLLALCRSSGMDITHRHPSFDALAGMIDAAWRDVLEAEIRWRNYEFSGMPDRKPSPMCNIQISDSFKTC